VSVYKVSEFASERILKIGFWTQCGLFIVLKQKRPNIFVLLQK